VTKAEVEADVCGEGISPIAKALTDPFGEQSKSESLADDGCRKIFGDCTSDIDTILDMLNKRPQIIILSY
jgi:hypothetical protein